MMATAIAVVITKAFNNSTEAGSGASSAKLTYDNSAFIYKIGPLTINIFLIIGIIILVCAAVFLFKTKWGLRLRSCGEHPQAADSVGMNPLYEIFCNKAYISTYIIFGLFVVLSIWLYKSKIGTHLRACGEHPQAADSVGIIVYQWRYIGVMISGALGGLGGFAYIVPSVTTWNFEVGVAGAGFLALAVMIFGQWKPYRIAAAAVFFAVFRSLANIADSTALSHFGLSKNIYSMMPFIASMIILAFTSKNSHAPKAEGIPYDKGAR